jgi:endonuclease/exonuclease/phosphatase family metal-dependent hydrolase
VQQFSRDSVDRRIVLLGLLFGLFLALLPFAARANHLRPPVVIAPAGEITFLTVNAFQGQLRNDPGRLDALADAFRSRPISSSGSFYVPDVISIQEITMSQLETLRTKLNGLFTSKYSIFGSTAAGVDNRFLINATLSPGSFNTWVDVCMSDHTYQWGRLTESASGAAFIVAGVHFSKNYTDPEVCREQNVDALRSSLAGQAGPIIAGGDFNKRPMTEERECDPEETSAPRIWWNKMTSFSSVDGRTYGDTVRVFNRANNKTMFDEWTHERPEVGTLCNNVEGIRRGRIDYVFASSATVLEAHADHPGWAVESNPGATSCDAAHPNCKYSDHRFVWAHLRVGTGTPSPVPAAPTNLTAQASSSTQIQLQWSDNATNESGYKIERGTSSSGPWTQIATTAANVTSYTDTGLAAQTTYYYRVRASNASGDSPYSNTATATTPPDTTPPTAPTNLVAQGGNRRITLGWTCSTDSGGSGLVGYEVFRGTSETGSFIKVATVTGASACTYTNTGLKKGTTYYYFVKAFDSAGNRSAPSNTASATTS